MPEDAPAQAMTVTNKLFAAGEGGGNKQKGAGIFQPLSVCFRWSK